MKRKRWFCALWAWVLAFCAAFGSVGGLASGLRLEENMLLLAAVFAIAAAVAAVCCVFRLYLLPLGSLIVLCAMFWKRLLASARFLVEQASRIYDRAYHWGVPQWQEDALEVKSAIWILAVLGGCVICVVVTAVLSGRGLRAGALMVLIPLIPCIIVTDTVPGNGYLFLILLSVTLLVLSGRVRADSLRWGNVLLLRLVLPVVLGLGLLFLLVPREGYDGQAGAQKLEEFVVSLVEEEPFWARLPQTTVPVDGDQKEQVDLSQIGVNPKLGLRVMSVKAEQTGTLYLRGSAYDTYTGTGWQASGKTFAEDAHFTGQGQLQYLTIQTTRVHSVLYVPHAPYRLDGGFTDGRRPNTEKLREYTVAYREPAAYSPLWNGGSFAVSSVFADACLLLPPDTLLWAKEYLPQRAVQYMEQGRIYHAAMEIADLVRNSARYDRMTSAMPAGESDFARWFLEESDTGYCTHFATAATVLLRAAGIPARYVTGYLANTQSGRFAQVTTDDAHAWVEFYIRDAGWMVLDATPGQTDMPTQTEPEQTAAATTQPSASQMTEETTLPSQATPHATQPSEAPTPSEETPTAPESPKPNPTQPQGSGPTDQSWELPAWMGTLLRTLLVLLTMAGVTVGQWRLRLWLRQNRLRRSKPNARLLLRWREAEKICRLLKQQPPEKLRQLAQKARFSQHTITKQELLEFDREVDILRATLQGKPFGWQLIYRLVFALY